MCKCLAIITARGGSKRIPRKNIRNFCGQPIIKYSIDAALNSKCFDEVMVSTEDKEIAKIALALGAKVPFMRSKETAGDFASSADVVMEVLGEYKKKGVDFEYLCCIFPTAPFISVERLKEGFMLLKTSDAASIFLVTQFSYPVQRALKIENGRLKMIWPENLKKRSQDLIVAYHDCGQFYWVRTKNFLEQKELFADPIIPLVVSETEAHDIDTEEDWRVAELKYKLINFKTN